jgi:hypothetical protein
MQEKQKTVLNLQKGPHPSLLLRFRKHKTPFVLLTVPHQTNLIVWHN